MIRYLGKVNQNFIVKIFKIQLNDRVDIYREYADRDDGQLEYKLTDRVNHAFDCSLLVSRPSLAYSLI